MAQWETVMGLETHVELSTKTKIFCSCTTAFGGAPNTHCCPVCTGMPGTLPVLNRKVVEYAVRAGLALGCEITHHSKFDRKNYFYPDLPKAYQISQLYSPIATCGCVPIEVGGTKKEIRIHEIHMEEDAGKLVHDEWQDRTQCDYNRCGVPLIEIVTEPDFRSAEEVVAYLEKLRSILQYLDVSDCKMQEGSLRCDVNLSVRHVGQETFGTRTEMKNINSFKAITRAIAFEADRQIELLEEGRQIRQETRRWDDNKGRTSAMRSKEDAQDYRYFPEPDLPPIEIDEAWLREVRESLPEQAPEKKQRYMSEFELSSYDAQMLTSDPALAKFFEAAVSICGRPKEIANWMMGEMMKAMKQTGLEPKALRLTPENLAEIVEAVESGKVNRTSGKKVFAAAFEGPMDVAAFIQKHGMEISSDAGLVAEVVRKVLEENPQSVQDFHAGKEKAKGFLMGQAMRALRGSADPQSVEQELHKQLSEA